MIRKVNYISIIHLNKQPLSSFHYIWKYCNVYITLLNRDNALFAAILDDKLMTANVFVFFVAGFETTASTMAYCLLELAANLDVQERMRQEIVDAITKHDGNLTYDVVKNLQYMDQVISGKNCILHGFIS